MIYKIIYSDDTKKDLSELADTITYEFKAPLTSFRYIRELRKVIHSLKRSPEAYAIQTRQSLQQYGANVRRINYKRMAVIYTVHDDTVYIHRVVPASMITGL